MSLFRYHCSNCGKTYIGERLAGSMTCNCNPPRQIAGQLFAMPYVPPPVTGIIAQSAVNEIIGRDKILAAALRMVINGTAGGRSAPSNPFVKHIHIGGVGAHNLFFDDRNQKILGMSTCGHIDSKNPAGQQAAATAEGRVSDQTVSVTVYSDGNITSP